jgi:hypothetical protein
LHSKRPMVGWSSAWARRPSTADIYMLIWPKLWPAAHNAGYAQRDVMPKSSFALAC